MRSACRRLPQCSPSRSLFCLVCLFIRHHPGVFSGTVLVILNPSSIRITFQTPSISSGVRTDPCDDDESETRNSYSCVPAHGSPFPF